MHEGQQVQAGQPDRDAAFGQWIAAIRCLRLPTGTGPEKDVAELIRQAHLLARLTPCCIRGFVRPAAKGATLEHMLAQGRLDAAAICLLGAPLVFTARRTAASGTHEVEIRAGASEHRGRASHGRLALALVGAWKECLLCLPVALMGEPVSPAERTRPNAAPACPMLPLRSPRRQAAVIAPGRSGRDKSSEQFNDSPLPLAHSNTSMARARRTGQTRT